MPQFRARSLRTALFATAVLTAVAVPASAAQAAPNAQVARTEVLQAAPTTLVKPYTLTVDATSVATDGPTRSTRNGAGAALGEIQWGKKLSTNKGTICDRGAGFTVVTFTYHRTLARDVVRKFAVREGCGSTAHKVYGTFGQVSVRVEKILPNTSLKTWKHAWV